MNDGLRVMVNTDDISRIEERSAGCIIYYKTSADDFDGSRHQTMTAVQETYDFFRGKLNIF
jgi:hypothetical protein